MYSLINVFFDMQGTLKPRIHGDFYFISLFLVEAFRDSHRDYYNRMLRDHLSSRFKLFLLACENNNIDELRILTDYSFLTSHLSSEVTCE